MKISVGDRVRLRDKRSLIVTHIADQDPDAYRVYDEETYKRTGAWKVNAEMPGESILIGELVGHGGTVVTDISEVVAVEPA